MVRVAGETSSADEVESKRGYLGRSVFPRGQKYEEGDGKEGDARSTVNDIGGIVALSVGGNG